MHSHAPHSPGTAPPRQAGFFHAIILLSTVICGTLAATVIGPVLPAMQQHFAAVPHIETLVPIVVTIPMLVLGVLAILLGWVADKVGRKRLLVGALLLYAIAGTAPLYLPSIYTILGSRVVVGIAEAAVMTCSTALIGDFFSGTQRDRYVSLQTTFASISAFIFNLLGGALGEHGWRMPFGVYAITLLLAPMVQLFIWEPPRTPLTVGHPGGSSTPLTAAQRTGTGLPVLQPGLIALACLVAFVGGVVFLMTPIHLSFMLVDLGTHASNRIGMAYAVNSVGVIAGTLTFGWLLVGRLKVMHQLLAGTMVCGIGFILMGNAHDFFWLTLGGAINGYGCGIILPASIGWVLRLLPYEHRAVGVGAFMASQSFGYFSNPLLVMPLAAHLGSRFPVLNLCGVVLLILAAAVLLASKRTHRSGLGKQAG